MSILKRAKFLNDSWRAKELIEKDEPKVLDFSKASIALRGQDALVNFVSHELIERAVCEIANVKKAKRTIECYVSGVDTPVLMRAEAKLQELLKSFQIKVEFFFDNVFGGYVVVFTLMR